MKKKIFIGIAMSLFAVATVINMNIAKKNEAKEISLESIAIMAQAQNSESGSCPGGSCTGSNSSTGMSCSACCEKGQTPRCNNVGCTCV
jgi:hypothetical protein